MNTVTQLRKQRVLHAAGFRLFTGKSTGGRWYEYHFQTKHGPTETSPTFDLDELIETTYERWWNTVTRAGILTGPTDVAWEKQLADFREEFALANQLKAG